MAIFTGHFPRIRLAPASSRNAEEPTNLNLSLAASLPIDRLNRATADGDLRLHLTGLFVLGLTAFAAIAAVI